MEKAQKKEFKVGDLVTYKEIPANCLAPYVTLENKIGLVQKVYQQDIFAEKPNENSLIIEMALVSWSNGDTSTDPIMLLTRYKDVEP